MQALVLVGGEGTRLRPLTATLPKPVVPLAGRPLISYMIEWLAGHGVEEVILACGFRPDALREALGEGEPGGPRLRYLTEPRPLGTAGAIRFAADLLRDRFLALNGDVLTDLDLTRADPGARGARRRATLGLVAVDDASAYGLVRTGPDGEVTEFIEKPEGGRAVAGEINAGAYVLERSVLEEIEPEAAVSIERDVFPRLVGDGLHALPLAGYWLDIGTPERYLRGDLGHPRGKGRDRRRADLAGPARRRLGGGRPGGRDRAARGRLGGLPDRCRRGGQRLGPAAGLRGRRGRGRRRLDPLAGGRGRARSAARAHRRRRG